MTTMKYMKMARQCKELFGITDTEYRREFPAVGSSRVTNSVLFGFAFEKMRNLFDVINWVEVARTTVLESDCPDVRYTSSLSLPTGAYPLVTWEALEDFRAARKRDFVGIRRNVYLPFCVRLILTAFVLDTRGKLPIKVLTNTVDR